LVPINITKEAYSRELIVLFNRYENLKSEQKELVSSKLILEQPKELKKSLRASVVSKSTKLPIIPSTTFKNLVEIKYKNKSKATGQLNIISLLFKRNLG